MIVSIDIGTSYSSISMLGPEGKILSVDTNTGFSMYGSKYSLPSAVFVEDDGEVTLGQAAMNSRMRNPQNFRDEFKRNLGENIPILLGSRSFLPEDLYTEFFRHMKDCAEKVSGKQIELAYLTYPASYGKSKKDKIASAANAAGLFDLELVDEPTAAAMSYCAEGFVQDKQNLLIYDFGGGTFDVSLIRFENGEFRQLTDALGLERCGGIDIDRLIFRDMMSKVPAETMEMLQKNSMHYMRFVSQLSELAVKCKHHLSSADQFTDHIMVGFDSVPYSLTLEQYNQMIADMVGQTIQTCRRILEEAKLKVSDLSAVLLVGGTSRVRLVREMVEQMAGSVPVHCAADLELAVSQGALNYRSYKKSDPEPELDAEGWYQKGVQYEEENKPEETVACYRKAAEMGNVRGQYALAGCYQSGYGVQEDEVQAVTWYNKAAHQGDADSQYALGLCYLAGLGIEQDAGQAVYWLKKAKKQGHEEARNELKKLEEKRSPSQDIGAAQNTNADGSADALYEKGRRFEEKNNYTDAFYCYGKAAEQGHAEAAFALGRCYENGRGTAVNQNNAVAQYRKSANQGYAPAQYHLGTLHDAGKGVPKNHETAVRWYQRAAEQGYKAAEDKLGSMQKTTVSGHADAEEFIKAGNQYYTEKNYQAAMDNYRKAAELGSDAAQFKLGEFYFSGMHVKQDKQEAVKWYAKAAEQNHSFAQFRLARCLYNAEGVEKDEQGAINWLAALAHYEKADTYIKSKATRYLQYINEKRTRNYSMSKILEFAREFKHDKWYGLALECYEKAAHAGNAEAQYEVGEAYSYGRGVPASEAIANTWYRRAAAQGHQSAAFKAGVTPGTSAASRTSTGTQRQKGLLESAIDWFFGI